MHNFDILNSFAIFPITWGKNYSVDAVHDHEFLSCMFLILQVFPGKCLYGLWAELHEKIHSWQQDEGEEKFAFQCARGPRVVGKLAIVVFGLFTTFFCFTDSYSRTD